MYFQPPVNENFSSTATYDMLLNNIMLLLAPGTNFNKLVATYRLMKPTWVRVQGGARYVPCSCSSDYILQGGYHDMLVSSIS